MPTFKKNITPYYFYCLTLILGSQLIAKPPQEIPEELYDSYTLNQQIPVLPWYIDGSYPPEFPTFYSSDVVDRNIERVTRKEVSYYNETDRWLYEALEQFPVAGKEVAIIGSVEPWYESVILAYGGSPVTIEYNKIVTNDTRLQLMTVEEYEKSPKKFDVILSISSTEHDGLGRYGDPLNPHGDLECLQKIKEQMLTKDGLLFLAVPTGKDCLVWNAHRIYGPLRLPLLLKGWRTLNCFGFPSDVYTRDLGYHAFQPVFVLSPT